MDYGLFDSLLDSVFIVNENREILYCNEAGASLAESSVRRLTKKKPIYDIFDFSDKTLFVTAEGEWGKESATPMTEVEFKLKSGKEGHVQLVIQPFTAMDNSRQWAVVIRDTTLEEELHRKNQDKLKQLEDYSKNLEQMVEERTAQIKRANAMLNAIMNSLGQGFLVFDDKGECADFYTKACETILEKKPSGKEIWDVIGLEGKDQNTFKMWMQAVFSQALPFDNLKELAPKIYEHSDNWHVTLDYFPLKAEEKVDNVVLVATDKTAEYEANIALEKERQFARMVVKLITGRTQFAQFLSSSEEMIEELLTIADSATESDFDHEMTFRMLHTFEGEVATYSAQKLWQASRDAQEILEPIRFGTAENLGVALAVFKKEIIRLKSEYNDFLQENNHLFKLVGIGADRRIEITASNIDKILQDLQKSGLEASICQKIQDDLVMEPIGPAFEHYQDVASLVAKRQNKDEPCITIQGGETRYYSDSYRDLMASMVHAFRNAVDHGIEAPEEREMLGKSRAGNIDISIDKKAIDGTDWFCFCVKDDGQGIDPAKIRSKLTESMGTGEVDKMSDEEVLQYIFESGLTTRDSVGDFSGRGVGMEAIRYAAKALGGNAWVKSELGQGTELTIEVPEIKSLIDQSLQFKKAG